jgi:alkylhydroperoxidase family enzyme
MARIPLVDPDEPGAPGRETLLAVRENIGSDNNFFLAAANNPDVLDGLVAFGAGVYFGRHVDPRLTELAYLTASVVNSCHY